MIVVVNPSATTGHSFKGLHAYCAHDQDRAQTSERVDWIEARNIAANDPGEAWKIMAATARAQDDLKRAAGVKVHRSKHGPVMHVVLSFDKDEPSDRETMEAAADEFLAQLGADPAKMRGKSKPKRRQFADEHQCVMYAHSDTDNHHLHLMINTIHPEHGIKLPTNNNWKKAQKWALDFSKRMGTAHKTPARAENLAMREAGEYVKGPKRKARNAYEQEKAYREASNDNDAVKAALEAEKRKDHALALRGRNMEKLHAKARGNAVTGHKTREEALSKNLNTQIRKAESAVREEFRPQWRELTAFQEAEAKTFEGLESSWFGRAGNVLKAIRASSDDVQEQKTNLISRAFKILTNAGERRAYFERGQERAQKALQRRQSDKLSEAVKSLNASHSEKLAANRGVFLGELRDLEKVQDRELKDFKAALRARAAQKTANLAKFSGQQAAREKLLTDHDKAGRKHITDREAALLDGYLKGDFSKGRSPAREQQNKRDRDDDRER